MAIHIEIDGKKIETTRDEIKEMLDQGAVTLKTPVWVSGTRRTVGDLVDSRFICALKKCFGFWLESKNSEGKKDPTVACCGCMAIGLGTLVFIFVLIGISPPPKEHPLSAEWEARALEKKTAKEEKERRKDAFYSACQFIERDQLSPKSAKFCGYDEAIVSPGDNNEYTVGGWVESQNAFNATIRKNWSITIRLDGTTWRHVYGPVYGL